MDMYDPISYVPTTIVDSDYDDMLCVVNMERQAFVSLLRDKQISDTRIQTYETCFPIIHMHLENEWHIRPYVGELCTYLKTRNGHLLARHKICFNELPEMYRFIFPLDENEKQQLVIMNNARNTILQRYEDEMNALEQRKHDEIVNFVRTYSY